MRRDSGIEGKHPSRPGPLLSARPVFFIDTGIVIGAVLAKQFRQEIGHFAVRRQSQILEQYIKILLKAGVDRAGS